MKSQNQHKEKIFKRVLNFMVEEKLLMVISFIVFALLLYTLSVLIKDNEKISLSNYYDEGLNYGFTYPKYYDVYEPSQAKKKQTLNALTTGMNFNLNDFKLKKEILSVALKSNAEQKGNKILTVAFIPSQDESYSELDDKENLLDEMLQLIKGLKGEEGKIDYIKDKTDDGFAGVEIKAQGKIGKTSKVFYQYREPAGKNILVVTYSSDKAYDSWSKDIETFVSDLKYYQITGLNKEYLETVDENNKVVEKSDIDKEVEAEKKVKKETEEASK